jgi:hypothetical protein
MLKKLSAECGKMLQTFFRVRQGAALAAPSSAADSQEASVAEKSFWRTGESADDNEA